MAEAVFGPSDGREQMDVRLERAALRGLPLVLVDTPPPSFWNGARGDAYNKTWRKMTPVLPVSENLLWLGGTRRLRNFAALPDLSTGSTIS